VQRSSESIGAIAAALAKAQAELTNPEKSLIATIRASHPRENDQTFRYAALSSGLDIVRKALGGHEIATVQTTAIDNEAGLIRLTTTLAHSSGEWLSSEWPVCPISETTAPRRMGAALTYARRYALFTLVGIAGEDDLDAPDLGAGGNSDTKPDLDIQTSTKPATDEPSFAPPGASRKGKAIRPPRIVLATDQSEALRHRLVAELSDLKSADEAADWVHKKLPLKNTLTPADAETVEASFRERPSRSRVDSRALGYRSLSTTQAPNTCRSKPKPSAVLRRPLRQQQSSGDAALRRRPSVCATRSTADSSPGNPASSAVARPPKRITFASPNPARWAARSATSTRFQSAGSIIATSMATAMRPHGGPGSASIPCRSRSNFGGDQD
jgi:hypothetical protein